MEKMYVVVGAFIVMCVALIVLAVQSSLKHNNHISKRLSSTPDDRTAKKKTKAKSNLRASKNMIAKFGNHLTLPDEKEITRIRFRLAQAGYYHARTVSIFYALRVISLFLPLAGMMAYWAIKGNHMAANRLMLFSAMLIIIGLMAPDFILNSRIKKRKRSAQEGFPDMMDLLVTCIEAGLGLDAALRNVARELAGRFPVIQVNLDLLNLELMAGRERYIAFKNFGDRLGLEEAKALNIMLKQSEEMGSSLGSSLRIFSEEMRNKRMMRAEEKAMALPAKLTIPLILFIFPTIMTMLFLPAAARLSGAF
jgi:tight adherence protein C